MSERVKLTFQRSSGGELITIRKDGGFTVEDVTQLTRVVEEMFHGDKEEEPDLEPGELEEDSGRLPAEEEDEEPTIKERSAGQEKDPFLARVEREAKEAVAKAGAGKKDAGAVGDATPPAGRGQVAAKTKEGLGFKKDGEVDRRTLKGSPEQPNPTQQKMVKKVEKAVGGKEGAP